MHDEVTHGRRRWQVEARSDRREEFDEFVAGRSEDRGIKAA